MSMESQRKSKSSIMDSSKTDCDTGNDSGFMSGSIPLSSTSLGSEELSAPFDKDVSADDRTNDSKCKNVSTKDPDSGYVDSGLTNRISSLNIGSESLAASESLSENLKSNPTIETRSPLQQMGLSPVHITILKEIYKKDDDGDTQLHIAVMRGFYEVVWNITRLLPHQALLDIPNNSGRTALHLAVAGGNSSLARHLIVCGASPVARNLQGDTALHVACSSGDYAMVSMITTQVTSNEVVQARLTYSPSHTPGLLAADFSNYDGQTCIHVSAKGAHKDILQHLTWFGADINAKECKCGRTALHLAVESRNCDLVRFLSENCRAALSIQTYAGLTPYQLAVANDVPTLATLLEELGATKENLPTSYAVEDDPDVDDDSINFGGLDLPWTDSDIQIGCMTSHHVKAVPVSTHGGPCPLNADGLL